LSYLSSSVSVMRQVLVVWMLTGLAACTRVGPSSAPLSSGSELEREVAAAPTQRAASAPGATASPKVANKHGKRSLYRRACELGSPVACNDLAILFGEDLAQAMPLFERACALGLDRGCANWGVQILRHQPSDAEHERAVGLLSRACDQSDAFACAELGDAMYATFEQSGASAHGRAHVAYEKACKLGYIDACANDGWMFRNGEGTTKNTARARELFRFACERESYAGCAALGYDLMDDAKNGDEYAEGTRWLKLACDHDDAFGCFSIGAALVSSGDAASLDGGIALLKRACSLGSADGCRFAEVVEKGRQYRAAGPAPGDAGDDEDADD
jgi:uncharacterized protein